MSDELPKLRPLDIRWLQWQGLQFLSLHDPLRLGQGDLLVPQAMAPLLGLCDGTRDLATLRIGYLLRTGLDLLPNQVESFVRTLDDAFLLDNERFRRALAQGVERYRCAAFRAPALAGAGYPEEPTKLSAALDAYCRRVDTYEKRHSGPLVGLISPHIDYTRGWRTYAETWQQAREAVAAAELVILLGTDHAGSPGGLTLTRQSYATPWGTLPTDVDLVNCLANILGEDRAFAEEVHHIGEHSIELACVWLCRSGRAQAFASSPLWPSRALAQVQQQ